MASGALSKGDRQPARRETTLGHSVRRAGRNESRFGCRGRHLRLDRQDWCIFDGHPRRPTSSRLPAGRLDPQDGEANLQRVSVETRDPRGRGEVPLGEREDDLESRPLSRSWATSCRRSGRRAGPTGRRRSSSTCSGGSIEPGDADRGRPPGLPRRVFPDRSPAAVEQELATHCEKELILEKDHILVADGCIELACPFSDGPTGSRLHPPRGTGAVRLLRHRTPSASWRCCVSASTSALAAIIAASRWRSRPPRRGPSPESEGVMV
jgi:hypothetical protein